MSLKSKMTSIADKIRSILGISEPMGLDGMSENLDACQNEVNVQSELLEQALLAIENKASGGVSSDPILQEKSVTPSVDSQIVLPDDGYDGLSLVSVSGDPDLVSENIKSGVSIFGVTGEYSGVSIPETTDPVLQSKTVTPTEYEQVVEPDNGYDGLSSVAISAIDKSYIGSEVETKGETVYTPGVSSQVISAGRYLTGDQVIIGDEHLVPDNIKQGIDIFGIEGSYSGEQIGVDTSDATATPGDLVDGVTAYVNGEKIIGTLEDISSYTNNGSFSMYTVDGIPRVCLSGSYPSGGYVPVNGVVKLDVDMSKFGNATTDDVIAGKKFTSNSGLNITGTYTPPAGLPSGISKIATGTFKLSSASGTHSISHGLGVTPNFINVIAAGTRSDTTFKNYVLYYSSHYMPSSIWGRTTDCQVLFISGYDDGLGATDTYYSGSPVTSFFNENRVYLDTESDSVKFKSGVTYRWICGLADF